MGHQPWSSSSSSKKQVKYDLTLRAADIKGFINKIISVGVETNIMKDVNFIFHDVIVLLNPLAAKDIIEYLKNQGDVDFVGDK